MWTPRRILLLCLGWTLVLGFYIGYSFVLGSIDGLPPLPAGLMPHSREHLPPLPARPASRVSSKLQLAFGPDCPEVSRQIKIDISSKKMVFAADQFQPEPDGRVSLKPLSVAIFNSDKANPRLTEISTIRGQVAYLKFDRPVTQLSDISSRKIVAAEISGSIEVTNNRRTQGRDDDLSVFIPTGPLHYADARKLIWTNDTVHLVDNQSKPKPIDVRGKGLEIELANEVAQPNQPAQQKKPKGDTVAGVKRVKLVESVDMHLHVREDSGFLNQNQLKAEEAPGKAPPEQQAYIRIKTPGSFEYLFRSEKEGNLAVFSLPEPQPGGPPSPADIFVTRHHEGRGATDQLMCERLELILRRKESGRPVATAAAQPAATAAPPPVPGSGPTPAQPGTANAANPFPAKSGGTEIESAHATGKEVILLSDAERLEAHGDDLLFEAKLHRTTLSGKDGMSAMMDGSILKARRLEIEQHKPGQSASRGLKRLVAQGPGQILMKEKDPKRKPSRASWRDTLISERDGPSERLTLNGQAAFTDEENDQVLNADTLKVWLPARNGEGNGNRPGEAKTAPGTLPKALGASANPSRKTNKPERVEALGKVYLRGREIVVHDSHRLQVWFKDVVTTAPGTPQKVLPAMPAPNAPLVVNGLATPSGPAGSAAPAAGGPASPNQPRDTFGLGLGNKDPKVPPRPLDLTARSIEAWIFRMENRDRLDRLRCEGTVQVRQEPARPDEKGLDIRGETLQLTGSPEGNLLTVTGDLAQLRMDRKLIVGPEVNIDEAANKVWVTGIGAIQMESLTNFQGDKLSKPVPMEVHWNKSMLLNGQYAEFHGGIQAEQEQARLACQGLQVYFDKPISLRNGGKGAHVQNLVCDQRVRVEDSVRENGKLVRYQRIVAVTLSMNQLEREEEPVSPMPNAPAKKNSEIRASGPGEVRVLQRGGAEPSILAGGPPGAVPPPEAPGVTASAAKPKTPATDKQQLKMTYVSFQKSMFGSNTRQNKASFLENVRVLNFPCDDPNVEIDIDKVLERMPPEALYLRCDKLDVLSHQENGATHQEMRARGRVVVQARGYSGAGELVTYDEAKGQVIFHGSSVDPAVLYYQPQPGAKPKELKAKKIFYNRITGEIRTDEASSLGGI